MLMLDTVTEQHYFYDVAAEWLRMLEPAASTFKRSTSSAAIWRRTDKIRAWHDCGHSGPALHKAALLARMVGCCWHSGHVCAALCRSWLQAAHKGQAVTWRQVRALGYVRGQLELN